tara:strand:- start:987 stop:1247 length:261 start_codon:yes stop_codon:yes gene_type:complete
VVTKEKRNNMAFKMKYKNLQGVVDELRGAVKAHGKQADTIEKHIDKMEDSPMKKKKGLDGKACWKGYKLQGTKKKGGKTVDNCVKM